MKKIHTLNPQPQTVQSSQLRPHLNQQHWPTDPFSATAVAVVVAVAVGIAVAAGAGENSVGSEPNSSVHTAAEVLLTEKQGLCSCPRLAQHPFPEDTSL